eukprot:COSAG01_NODE_11768_length_1862_cov_217.705048_1_plen_151_part_10
MIGLPDPVPNPDYINLEQLKGVTVEAGPGVNDRGHPETYIDMVHTPAEWTKSPAGSVTSCAQALYMTVDLGAFYEVGSVTVWNYYGDTRKYCGQKIALSATGSFAGEETVVYDTKQGYGPYRSHLTTSLVLHYSQSVAVIVLGKLPSARTP